MKAIIITMAMAVMLIGARAGAQTYDTNNISVQTFAGFGLPAYVDGQGQFSAFSSPMQIVADSTSNLYVWDSGNFRVRKILPNATVTTFAGGGAYLEGYGTNVSLAWSQVSAMAIDHTDTLWLVLAGGFGGSSYLMTIGTNGYVSIQNGGLTNLGDGSGICFDSANNLYYSGGNRIYRYNSSSGISQPFVGNSVAGNFDGQGPVFTAFNNPTALACDQANNIYVWDSGNGTIRRVDQNQNVVTIAGNGNSYSPVDGIGTNAGFSGIASLFTDHWGNLYLVSGSCVRKMDAQTNVTTLAGTFYQYSPAFADGPGYLAHFNSAAGGCLAQGIIFIADAGNNRIRSITANAQPQAVAPANLQLNTYPGLQINGIVGRTYEIQSSPDTTNWSPGTKLLLGSSPYLWIDQAPVSGNKFYRAVMLP